MTFDSQRHFEHKFFFSIGSFFVFEVVHLCNFNLIAILLYSIQYSLLRHRFVEMITAIKKNCSILCIHYFVVNFAIIAIFYKMDAGDFNVNTNHKI